MKAKSSNKSSSGRCSAPKAPKASAKGVAKPKTKWKVVGDKVVFNPGRYTLADMKAALKALENATER